MNKKTLKIAILGAHNFGRFHAREFLASHVELVAILGRTPESADRTAKKLNLEFNLNIKAYSELEKLIESESIDAVSVCTPPKMHFVQVEACLNAGLHVLCEKPFVLESYANNYPKAETLTKLAKKKQRILTVNTQWPAILSVLKKRYDFFPLNSLSVFSQPGEKGIGMLLDHLPHASSILVSLIPGGRAKDMSFLKNSEESMAISFNYLSGQGLCKVNYTFKFKADRPREIKFGFNGKEFSRELDENYRQTLTSGSEKISIEDPLKTSIGKFVSAVQGHGSPLIGREEMLENVALQDKIISEYLKEVVRN